MNDREKLEIHYELARRKSAKSAREFLNYSVINSSPEPRLFSSVADPWQWEMMGPKIEALEGLEGLRDYQGPRSFLTVLPRGHDKSSAEGRLASHALCFSKRKIEGYLCAADGDQGELLLRAMQDEAKLNPWYAEKLDFKRGEVVGPMGRLEVVPADAGSAYGFRGNLFIMDEITHWKNDKMWGAIVSGRHKRPDSLLVCITNAGTLGSWQDVFVRQVAYRSPEKWCVFERPGSLASWLTPESIAETAASLPEPMVRRLLQNEWIDPAEDSGYLTGPAVDACEDESVPFVGVPIRGAQYVCSVDYGETKDRCVVTILYKDRGGEVKIAEMNVWRGSPQSPVQVEEVENWVLQRNKSFRYRMLVADPHQMVGSLQKWEKAGIPVKKFSPRGGAANLELATNLRTLVFNGKLKYNPRHGYHLSDELKHLVVKMTPAGWRMDHKVSFHDDQAVSIGMGALEAVKLNFILPPEEIKKLIPPAGNSHPWLC